ncbi:MAG: HNH endonuclease [Bacillota bacterium]|nr:HNH endonuclease [Bacillota bacterium]
MKREYKHICAQKEGKVRDLFTCQICGSKENVEGHHIFDFAFGGAADKENIISLCHDCHKGVHKGKIELFKF